MNSYFLRRIVVVFAAVFTFASAITSAQAEEGIHPSVIPEWAQLQPATSTN